MRRVEAARDRAEELSQPDRLSKRPARLPGPGPPPRRRSVEPPAPIAAAASHASGLVADCDMAIAARGPQARRRWRTSSSVRRSNRVLRRVPPEFGGLLEGVADLEHPQIGARRADDLQPDRQPVGGEAGGHAHRGHTRRGEERAGPHPVQVGPHRLPGDFGGVFEDDVDRHHLGRGGQQDVAAVEELHDLLVQAGLGDRRPAEVLPAISPQALTRIGRVVRRWRLHRRIYSTFEELARAINPIVARWMAYYGRFYRSKLSALLGSPSSDCNEPDQAGAMSFVVRGGLFYGRWVDERAVPLSEHQTRSRSCRCETKRKVTMYAVMMRVRVDDLQKAVEQLERELIPVIKSAPGFRTGIWLSPDMATGEGLS